MKLANGTEYGLRALICLAEAGEGVTCSVSFISKKQNIPISFLEKILSKLKGSGIISAIKGKNGGYVLAKPLDQLNLKSLLESLEGEVAPFKKLVEQVSSNKLHCKSHLVWAMLQRDIGLSLEKVTLNQLI